MAKDGARPSRPAPPFNARPEKNLLLNQHIAEVINPLLTALRPRVGPGAVQLAGQGRSDSQETLSFVPWRTDRRRSARTAPHNWPRDLADFDYRGRDLPAAFELSSDLPVVDYFRQFRGLDPTAPFNHEGFWDLPIPVSKHITVAPCDVVIYDGEGYDPLRAILRDNGIRHVLLTGYNTDMCFCKTTAGYDNLSPDFNVFLVGDATVATFPANPDPRFATNAAISFAALDHLVTQVSWIKPMAAGQVHEIAKVHMSQSKTATTKYAHLAGELARRDFRALVAAAVGTLALTSTASMPPCRRAGLVAGRHHARSGNEPQLPALGDTHWDYEKGNLNDETKAYTVEACRRIKAAGGIAHLFRRRSRVRTGKS